MGGRGRPTDGACGPDGHRTIQRMKIHCALNRPGRARQSGFTLIEMMIVVGIIAILAAIAIPNYRDYVLRGQIVDATNALSTFRANMERHFQDNRTYETVGAFTSPCLLPVAQRTVGPFVVTCSGGSGGDDLHAAGGRHRVAVGLRLHRQSGGHAGHHRRAHRVGHLRHALDPEEGPDMLMGCTPARAGRARGFTLVELMITITLLAICSDSRCHSSAR